jgi:hypothetical protein
MAKNKNKHYDSNIDEILSKQEQTFKDNTETTIKPYKEYVESKKEVGNTTNDAVTKNTSKKIKVQSKIAVSIKNQEIEFSISTNKHKEITQDLYDKIIKLYPRFKNIITVV